MTTHMSSSGRFAIAMTALAIAVLAGSRAEAGYSYSTGITFGTPVGASGTVVNIPGDRATFTTTDNTQVIMYDIANPGNFIIPSTSTYNFANLIVTTSSATPETFTVPYIDVVTVVNPSPGGATDTFTIKGTLSLTNITYQGGASGGTVTNQYDAPLSQTIPNLGGALFVLNLGTGAVNDYFGPPTINSSQGGSVGGQISTSAVPEPTSVALVGIGVALLTGIGFRRRLSR